MHDIEIWMCDHPIAPRLPLLLSELASFDLPRLQRTPLVDELYELVGRELELATTRWTPHYDRVLRTLADATATELLEPSWSYGPGEPTPYPSFSCAGLVTHAHLCQRFEEATARGAQTLAGAFTALTIDTSDLQHWFALCPDLPALDRRLRDAALALLRTTRCESLVPDLELELIEAARDRRDPSALHRLRMEWYLQEPSADRQFAIAVVLCEGSVIDLDFTDVPLAVMELLGNPFDPRG